MVLLSYITAESGGDYPPVLKVGDLSPVPPAPTPMATYMSPFVFSLGFFVFRYIFRKTKLEGARKKLRGGEVARAEQPRAWWVGGNYTNTV